MSSSVSLEKIKFIILQRNIIHTFGSLETDLYSLDYLRRTVQSQQNERTDAIHEVRAIQEFIDEIIRRLNNKRQIID
jgi:hypothetical protein